MANTTVYPFGNNGTMPSNIGIVNDLTTGGIDKALSAEQGKVLYDKVIEKDSLSWGDTAGTNDTYGQYMWPFFKPLDVPCVVTKMYLNETAAGALSSNTNIELYVAELNDERNSYTITQKVTAILTAGESSVDLNISLPANCSLYVYFRDRQQTFTLKRTELPSDDAYPQKLVQVGNLSVGSVVSSVSDSTRAWSVKFDYTTTLDIKDIVINNTERIEALEEVADSREVTYKEPTSVLVLGSSLTDTYESYKGGNWLDILNDMVDVVIINGGKTGGSRQWNFQNIVAGTITHDKNNYPKNINPTYIFCVNTANMNLSNAVGVGAQADLDYGLNIARLLGSALMFGNELPMYHEGKEFDQTYTSFARNNGLLVSPYCSIAPKLMIDTPYVGFSQGDGANVHGGYRCKSYALTHYELLKSLPIRKSIKFFAVRPDYQGGAPTYSQLIYENNEERFVKFHGIKTGEGAWKGTGKVDNLDSDSYVTATGTSNGNEGNAGDESSHTSQMQRGAPISFSDFALCEVVLERIDCTKGTFQFNCSAEPSAIYVATRKASFATAMSEWTLLTHSYSAGVVTATIDRSEKDFMLYDKVRILICGSGSFTISKPIYKGYDGRLKPNKEPLKGYHIRRYGTELLAKTSCETGWTMGGNASVQSLPNEIANYSGYNEVKSHIELASDSDYCSKSVPLTQPCSRVAVRVVANLFPKIATSRSFSEMTSAEESKYISTTPTIVEYGYNFGTLRLSFGGGSVRQFIMWCGWCEYYFEADIAPTDTSLTLKIERLLAKDGVSTNSDFNVFIHDVSVQKIV